MKKAHWAIALSLALLGVGCDRTHLSPNYGVTTRQALKRQQNDPRAGDVSKPDQPLDPEESAIISKTYLRSMLPENQQNGDNVPQGGNLLVVPPAQTGGVPPMQSPMPR